MLRPLLRSLQLYREKGSAANGSDDGNASSAADVAIGGVAAAAASAAYLAVNKNARNAVYDWLAVSAEMVSLHARYITKINPVGEDHASLLTLLSLEAATGEKCAQARWREHLRPP